MVEWKHIENQLRNLTIIKILTCKEALRMLDAGNVNLTDIALQLGYAELSIFSRNFKSWFGVPPTELRDKSRSHIVWLLVLLLCSIMSIPLSFKIKPNGNISTINENSVIWGAIACTVNFRCWLLHTEIILLKMALRIGLYNKAHPSNHLWFTVER